MAEQISGKWKLTYADNVGEYCDAISCTENSRSLALKLLTPENNITQEISFKENTVTITTTMPGKTNKVECTLGSTYPMEYLDGRSIQCVFTLDDAKLKEEQSGSFQSTNVRYLDGDTLCLEMTANGVKTTRKYTKM